MTVAELIALLQALPVHARIVPIPSAAAFSVIEDHESIAADPAMGRYGFYNSTWHGTMDLGAGVFRRPGQ